VDEEYADDPGFVEHLRQIGSPHARDLAPDARRVGLDRNTPEGALLAFSGSLRSSKPSHRIVAWVLLAAFAFPVVLALLDLTGQLVDWLFTH
jgi:hypothetical protein